MGDNDTNNDEYIQRYRGWHQSLRFGDRSESVAPFVPSPSDVVHEMLTISEAGPGDILYDLGCGDGRILLSAVQEFNVDKAIGFEINQQMVEATKIKIRNAELEDRIAVYKLNFFDADLIPATLVTLYLTTSGNSKLRPKLEKELKTGTRIVSHDFPITDWETINPKKGPYEFKNHKIFLYKIPDSYRLQTQNKKKNNRTHFRFKSILDYIKRR
jgi:cyclopropane fatty-acyl-phospholipid synthase-like methyltransferase